MDCWDVISKLKDDGDFDKLRLKLIRKLKHNEELRDNIVSIVRQSVAINRPGAENMKPRQLSDAIHEEVGSKLNEQISDVLWEIIRSPDGMKREITETVKAKPIPVHTLPAEEQHKESLHEIQEVLQNDPSGAEHKVQGDDSDDDLDAPPGFG
nr:hypothetical protein [Tanacetum cinerariifolium]